MELLIDDGTVFHGEAFGALREDRGEVVDTRSLTSHLRAHGTVGGQVLPERDDASAPLLGAVAGPARPRSTRWTAMPPVRTRVAKVDRPRPAAASDVARGGRHRHGHECLHARGCRARPARRSARSRRGTGALVRSESNAAACDVAGRALGTRAVHHALRPDPKTSGRPADRKVTARSKQGRARAATRFA